MVAFYVVLLVALCAGFPAVQLRSTAGRLLGTVGLAAFAAVLVVLILGTGDDRPTGTVRAEPSWSEIDRLREQLRLAAAAGGVLAGIGFVALGVLADLCVRQGRALADLGARPRSPAAPGS